MREGTSECPYQPRLRSPHWMRGPGGLITLGVTNAWPTGGVQQSCGRYPWSGLVCLRDLRAALTRSEVPAPRRMVRAALHGRRLLRPRGRHRASRARKSLSSENGRLVVSEKPRLVGKAHGNSVGSIARNGQVVSRTDSRLDLNFKHACLRRIDLTMYVLWRRFCFVQLCVVVA